MKIKNIINKFISAFCAVLISFVTVHPVLTFSVIAAGTIGTLLDFANYASQVIDIVSSVYTETPGGLNQAKYLCAWMDIIKDTGISETDFKSYYEEIISRSEEWALGSDEYNTYLFIQDTSANGVSLDAICYMAYHDTGTDDYTIVENDDGKSDLVVSGKGIKDMAADYNSRYCPMPVQDFYVWSYQSSTTGTRSSRNTSDYLQSFQFEPYVPVYSLTSTTWGGKGWSGGKNAGVYILPFYYDNDNSHGVYYHKYYAHIYVIPATSDTVATLCLDVYSLSDGSLYQSKSCSWDSNYTYLSFNFASYFNVFGYKSSYDYSVHENFSRRLFSNSITNFYASDYTSGRFNTMIVSSTFSPDTDSEDDWGYYVQNKPFELFANQTQINFNNIPDNYVITINGDTIYDYSITNPDTGDTTTINNYIINNYTIPASDDPTDPTDPSDPTSPIISGNVTVSGNVDVSGKIEIDTKPIDINVNVNGGGSYTGTGEARQPYVDGENVDLTEYLDHVPEISKGFIDYLADFFSWLPKEIYGLLILALVVCIWCRLAGR